ncbi:MAG: hypothetical protein WBB45_09600 [Cyclobacteriaceae bacterium]
MKLQLKELEVNSLVTDSKGDIELRKRCSTDTCAGSGCPEFCDTIRGIDCLTEVKKEEREAEQEKEEK